MSIRLPTSPSALCHAALAVALACLPLCPVVGAEPARPEAVRGWQIPAGPLDDALTRLGREAGLLLSFPEALVAGRSTRGLVGEHGPAEALRRLLADTGLEATPQPGGGYVIRPTPVASPTAPASGTDPATGFTSASIPSDADPAATPRAAVLATVEVRASRPRLYDTPDVNAGALGIRDLQDLPYSLGSYTTDTVENQRARTALDVLRNDPSVTPVTYGASFDGVAVRGFSANTFNNVRRDGVLANVYADVPLENKERIDVLKGVSGFLHGVGDPSGLVNYIIKRPTRDPLLSVTVEARSQTGYYAGIDAGGPVGDGRLGYRLNAAAEKVGDFRHPGDLERRFIGGAMDLKLGRDTMAQLDFDYQHKEQSVSANLGPRSDGRLVPASSLDPRRQLGQPWQRYRSTSWNIGARLDHALSPTWTLTGQFGHGSTFRNAMFNNLNLIAPDGTVLDGNVSYEGEAYRVTSSQVFATGTVDLAGLKHQIVTGVGHSRMSYPEGPYVRLADAVGNIYAPIAGVNPGLPDDTDLPGAHSTQVSVFASDTVAFNDQWSALVGLRYIDYVNDKPRDYPDTGTRLRYETSATIPSLSLLFKPVPTVTVYGTWTKGFEQGAYAPGWADNAYQRLDPITSRQVEVGVKSRLGEGLMVSAALFDIDKPLQAVSSADNVFRTRGRQRHRGLELTAGGQLTPRLSGIIGLAWLDAEQQKTGDPAVDGRRPASVARFQANAFLDYRLPVLEGLSVNGGYYYIGNRPLTGTNEILVGSFGRFDLGAAYSLRALGKPTIVRFTVQNVADRRYWESVVYGTVGMGRPRTVLLSLTTQF